jgi:hypothetical protein
MAETAGLIQQLTILPDAAMACVWIGPAPGDEELLFVRRDAGESPESGAFENSMIDALVAAQAMHREVVAIHGDSDGRITSLRIDPA